jgi:hypothetical protein
MMICIQFPRKITSMHQTSTTMRMMLLFEVNDREMNRPPVPDFHAKIEKAIKSLLRSSSIHQPYLDGVQYPNLIYDEADLKVAATSIF